MLWNTLHDGVKNTESVVDFNKEVTFRMEPVGFVQSVIRH